ncbi:MAG: glycosyltransferase [Anaerolineae bacterium]|nr:glycosyltransferase [Anaerolineae bacterium]
MSGLKRILILTPQLPYPPQQGTAIRNYNLIAHLAARHRLHLLSFLQEGDELPPDSPLFRHCQRIETVPAPRRTLAQRLLTTLFSPLPDMALRLASPAFRERLAALIAGETYDVVQIEGIEMAPYGLWLRAWPRFASLRPRPLLVFDDHNAEYLLQRRVFETDARQPRRWAGALYSLIQWQKLSRYEAHICRQADRVAAVSEADAEALRRLVPGLDPAIVPNGVDLDYYGAEVPPLDLRSPALVFTGKMDFRPNVDAVLWFAEEVLPRIRAARPEVHFVVVGQKPHARLDPMRQREGVTLTGRVEDVRPYIAGAAVYVVPLRMGGGTRLKLLEAMAMGKAIVATSLGCEGFDVADGRELRMADTPEGFAAAVLELLEDEGQRARLGCTARRFVEARYGWGAIVPRLEELYCRATPVELPYKSGLI